MTIFELRYDNHDEGYFTLGYFKTRGEASLVCNGIDRLRAWWARPYADDEEMYRDPRTDRPPDDWSPGVVDIERIDGDSLSIHPVKLHDDDPLPLDAVVEELSGMFGNDGEISW